MARFIYLTAPGLFCCFTMQELMDLVTESIMCACVQLSEGSSLVFTKISTSMVKHRALGPVV